MNEIARTYSLTGMARSFLQSERLRIPDDSIASITRHRTGTMRSSSATESCINDAIRLASAGRKRMRSSSRRITWSVRAITRERFFIARLTDGSCRCR